MPESFWIFVSIAVFMGTLLPIVVIITKHQQSMKQLEIEGLKLKQANREAEEKKAAD